jgi:hypothetical protein
MRERLEDLLDLLDSETDEKAGTSIRLPANLRRAAAIASEMGLAVSMTELTVRGLRDVLEGFAQLQALEAHYQEHPQARPTLAELALAAAELDANPLAGRSDLIERAAAEIGSVKEDPTSEDVLLYAAGLASAAK